MLQAACFVNSQEFAIDWTIWRDGKLQNADRLFFASGLLYYATDFQTKFVEYFSVVAVISRCHGLETMSYNSASSS